MSGLAQSLADQSILLARDGKRRFAIGVQSADGALPESPLFATLAKLFPVHFRTCIDGGCGDLDALILVGQDDDALCAAAAMGIPVLALPAAPAEPGATQRARFQFSDSPALSACWRGHCFEEAEAAANCPLLVMDGDEVLALQDGDPIWSQRSGAGTRIMISAWPLASLGPGEHLYEYLQQNKLFHLLPLLDFLRSLTCEADWQSPATPACLVVDDPNLHAQTYGYLDFWQLANQARERGFTASIAMVPLDSWWVAPDTRELFCNFAPQISVLVHGNNHTHEELAHAGSEQENLALLAEALRRFERLEKQPGMEVCRVMECPHGALALEMLEPMARLGYEAVFASIMHLLRCNPDAMFHASLGAEPTLLMQKAPPVIPRIRTAPGWQTAVRLAAFLRQPIILATHHWDFAEGNHVADEFVEIVNRLPDVRWVTPGGVARACYQFRQVGEVMHLRLGSRMVDVPVRDGVRQVVMHRPWMRGAEQPELVVLQQGGKELLREESAAEVTGPVEIEGNAALRIGSSVLNAVDFHTVPPPGFRYWPVVRKLMVELRDRNQMNVHLKNVGPKAGTARNPQAEGG